MYSLLNRSGREYWRHGCKKASVGMKFKGFSEHKDFGFVWTKAQSANYKLSTGTELEKTGRALPVEVQEGTGIFPVDLDKDLLLVNFLTQLDPPLLRDLSESRMYNMVVKSMDGDRLQEALVLAKNDSDEFNIEISEATIELALTQKRLLALRDKEGALSVIVPLKKAYQANLLMSTKLKVIKQKKDQLGHAKDRALQTATRALLIEDALQGAELAMQLSKLTVKKQEAETAVLTIAQSNQAISEARKQEKLLEAVLLEVPSLTKPAQYSRRIAQLTSLRSKRTVNISEIASLAKAASDTAQALKGTDRIQILRKGIRKLAVLQGYQKSYKEADLNVQSTAKLYQDVSASIDDIENLINNGTCPVCRTSVGEDKMDLKQVQRNIDELKNRQASISGRLQSLEEQKEVVAEEIRALGIDPDNIDSEIDAMQKKIDSFEAKLAPVVEKINAALSKLDGDSIKDSGDNSGDSDNFDFGG